MESPKRSSTPPLRQALVRNLPEDETMSVAPQRLTPTTNLFLTQDDLKRLTSEPRYREEGLLGRGGMGEVSLCQDARIGRHVASKQLRPEFQHDSGRVLRLLREAVIQGQLEHPAIVPVYDLGLGAQGPYFTMRRVEGRSLSDVLHGSEGEPLSVVRLLSLFVTLCLAVDFAHRRGVLHRDIKPANVMIGAFGEVYLLDWGVARMEGDEASSRWEVRKLSGRQQGAIGTPGYMAPEAMVGGDAIDARSDVYALGAVLFEILTRQRLHEGDPADRLASTMRPAARPSQRVEGLSPLLDEICQRATALSPDDRYGTPRELSDAVSCYLESLQGETLRQQLAAQATQRGLDALQAGPGSSADARTLAVREAANALVLEPSNPTAASLLARVLEETPEQFPPSVEAAFRQDVRARRTSIRLLTWLRLLASLTVALGVLVSPAEPVGWKVAGIASSLLAAGASLIWGLSDQDDPSSGSASLFFLASLVALVAAAGVFGPFVMIPVLRLLLGISMLLGGYRPRTLVVGATVLSSALTYALAQGGLLPLPDISPALRGEGLLRAGHLYVATMQTALLALTLTIVGRFRHQQERNERRLFWQAWQLRQLGVVPARE